MNFTPISHFVLVNAFSFCRGRGQIDTGIFCKGTGKLLPATSRGMDNYPVKSMILSDGTTAAQQHST